MPTPRLHLATVVVNDKIYAIGGWDGEKSTSTVEVFHPTTNTWSKGTDMPAGRSRVSASVVNGIIYVIGGVHGGLVGALALIEAYDPETDMWTTETDMPTPRRQLSTSVVNGRIYAIGGASDAGVFSTVESFDTARSVNVNHETDSRPHRDK